MSGTPPRRKTLRPPPAPGRPLGGTMPPPPPGRPLGGTTPPPPSSRPLGGTTPPPPPSRPFGGTTPPPDTARALGGTTPPPLSALEVERNPFVVVRYADLPRLVVITRTAQEFGELADVRWMFERIDRAIEGVHRHRASLLIDSRRAPPRNDPEFERVFTPLRQELMGSFSRVALLLRSAVGVLQMSRLLRVDGISVGVYTDAAEALVYLGAPPDERLLAPLGADRR